MKLILLIFLLPFQLIAGRSYDIEFRILDDLTGDPIEGVRLLFVELDKELVTDLRGKVFLANCELSEVNVYINHSDYDFYIYTVFNKKRKNDLSEELMLKPNSELANAFFREKIERAYSDNLSILDKIDTNVIRKCDDQENDLETTWDSEFPGGGDLMRKFISYYTVYPEEAKEFGDYGSVYISFIVGLDGAITDIKIYRGISADLDREAKRIIASMPNWIPAYCNGRPIRTRISLPIRFTMY